MTKLLSTLAVLLALAFPPGAWAKAARAETITVDHWIDGDSPVDTKGVEYRLRGADAPEVAHSKAEKDQAWGQAAKTFAEKIAPQGTKLTIHRYAGESYGRPVVTVTLPDGSDLSMDEIESGWAWADPHYATQPEIAAMEEAKAAGKGLWQSRANTPPWIWREACKAREPIPEWLWEATHPGKKAPTVQVNSKTEN